MASPVWADFISSEGLLSDRDYYNLISCGAPPGGVCKKPHKRWLSDDARDLRVAVSLVQDQVPPQFADLLLSEITRAMEAISRVSDTLSMRWTEPSEKPHIKIYLVNAAHSGTMRDTGNKVLDGKRIANASVASNRKNGRITYAQIAFARSIDPGALYSIALEELYQALGFIYDIDNPAYRGLSLLDEHGSDVITIQGQDLMALRWKYAY